MSSPWTETGQFALRTLGVGLLIYGMSRYLPRRSGGGLAAYDFVFFWMMGGLAVAPLYDLRIRFVDTIAAVITIYLCHYAFSGLAMSDSRWAALLCGRPVTVVDKGLIQKAGMERALLPLEILFSELRRARAGSLSGIETATLETTGHISIIKKPDHLPLTKREVGMGGGDQPLPLLLVADGKIQRHNLFRLGATEAWLSQQLNQAHAPEVEAIYTAIWEGTEPIYWAPKSEAEPPSVVH